MFRRLMFVTARMYAISPSAASTSGVAAASSRVASQPIHVFVVVVADWERPHRVVTRDLLWIDVTVRQAALNVGSIPLVRPSSCFCKQLSLLMTPDSSSSIYVSRSLLALLYTPASRLWWIEPVLTKSLEWDGSAGVRSRLRHDDVSRLVVYTSKRNVIYTLLQQRNNQKLRNDIVLSIRVTIRTPQEASGRLV